MNAPYSKQAAMWPVTEELRIYFGISRDVWRYAKTRNHYAPALMLPPGEEFTRYQWPVQGRDVLAIQIGDYPEQSIILFCHHLVIQGAAIVRVLLEGEPLLARFIREERNAA